MITDKDTLSFMDIVYHLLTDENYYLLPIRGSRNVKSEKILVGYYDRKYIYLIPSVVIAMVDIARFGAHKPKINIQKVLQQLFTADMIKVHWILTGEVRYRPQKRVDNTRYRYITFFKKPLLSKLYRESLDNE